MLQRLKPGRLRCWTWNSPPWLQQGLQQALHQLLQLLAGPEAQEQSSEAGGMPCCEEPPCHTTPPRCARHQGVHDRNTSALDGASPAADMLCGPQSTLSASLLTNEAGLQALRGTKDPAAVTLSLGLEYENCQAGAPPASALSRTDASPALGAKPQQ